MCALDNGPGRADTWHRVAEVSTDALSALVRAGLRADAEPGDSGLLVFLGGAAIEAYIQADIGSHLAHEPVLKLFFSGHSVRAAAQMLSVSERSAQRWVSDFAAFLRHRARVEEERQRQVDAAWAYCAESCGRKKFHEPPAPERRTSSAKTAKTPRSPRSRCPSCPLTALGV